MRFNLHFGVWGILLQIWNYRVCCNSRVLFCAIAHGSRARQWGFEAEWANPLTWTFYRGLKRCTYALSGPIRRIA